MACILQSAYCTVPNSTGVGVLVGTKCSCVVCQVQCSARAARSGAARAACWPPTCATGARTAPAQRTSRPARQTSAHVSTILYCTRLYYSVLVMHAWMLQATTS